MSVDTKRLRELAMAATQGPWTSDVEQQGKGRSSYRVLDADNMCVADCDGADNDAAFIAAANPQAVLALLDEIVAISAARDEACAIAMRAIETLPATHRDATWKPRIAELRKANVGTSPKK